MNLQETAEILCQSDASHSPYVRAIKLFEFQVAIFAPGSEALQRHARVFAAIKILEHIEKLSGLEDRASLTERLKLPGYSEIANVIFQAGGWRRIRSLWNTREFDEQLAIRMGEAKSVARLADFSYRFVRLKPNDLRRGLSTMARHVVKEINKNKAGFSESTIKTRWREYKSTAAFDYLVLIQKIGSKPLKLSKKHFVENLLRQASDVEQLRYFFAAYVEVSKVLRPRGFPSDPISGPFLKGIKPNLSVPEFSEDEDTAILAYKP
ncbi:MAG: hypothetical protein E7813_17435 [Bradyrhizobium sp.]|uniref:hypothetical protein n=1 Tax=Bradyrhizobium sp. TaxID=376 RepID=UPI0012146000|nr:hypothetical protein [Bradyrhizobium sp.]THD63775.1 MAG: hypothetical protein E7813_17435 [Bradyrhizobium sp.]